MKGGAKSVATESTFFHEVINSGAKSVATEYDVKIMENI
jgi:hypothetical protein